MKIQQPKIMEKKKEQPVSFKKWLVQVYNLGIAAGHSSHLLVLCLYSNPLRMDSLKDAWAAQYTPLKAFQFYKSEVESFKEVVYKKYTDCKTLKERAEWFYYRWPSAQLNQKTGKYLPRVGGVIVSHTEYNTREEALLAASETIGNCGVLFHEVNNILQDESMQVVNQLQAA